MERIGRHIAERTHAALTDKRQPVQRRHAVCAPLFAMILTKDSSEAWPCRSRFLIVPLERPARTQTPSQLAADLSPIARATSRKNSRRCFASAPCARCLTPIYIQPHHRLTRARRRRAAAHRCILLAIPRTLSHNRDEFKNSEQRQRAGDAPALSVSEAGDDDAAASTPASKETQAA